MRIIILNQFFYPDHSATSQLMTELAEGLVARGVEVTALAGRGRYNGGANLPPREDYKGIRIKRAWATNFGKNSIVGRLADYLSFYVGATWKLLTLPRHDLVMALTTPPLIGLIALLVARLRRMSMIALVQDVYPDVAIELGVLRAGNLLTRLLDRLNRTVLRRATGIIVLSRCMQDRIAAKIGTEAAMRIDVIHNWADGEDIKPLNALESGANPFSRQYGLQDKFVVLFSGNFGRVNEFSTVLEAARLLREHKEILFLFVGDGAKALEIEGFVRQHALENVLLMPYQPREQLRYSLAAGDALLVTLREGLAGLSVPSKTYPILAAGRPLLFVGDMRSDVAQIVTEHECGAAFASGESSRLAETIVAWSKNKQLVAALGASARRLFDERFDRSRAVDAYLETFVKCLNPSVTFQRECGSSSTLSSKQN